MLYNVTNNYCITETCSVYKHTHLAPADETSDAGLSRSQESWMSGRLLTERDELLPIRPVRTFNLADREHILLVPVMWLHKAHSCVKHSVWISLSGTQLILLY